MAVRGMDATSMAMDTSPAVAARCSITRRVGWSMRPPPLGHRSRFYTVCGGVFAIDARADDDGSATEASLLSCITPVLTCWVAESTLLG